MRPALVILFLIFFAVILLARVPESRAQDDAFDLPPKEVFARIPGLQDDLLAKMKKRDASMAKLTNVIIRGDYTTIKTEIDKIANEYSIEFNLDPDVAAEYNSIMSSEFIFADQNLSQYAMSLSSAAEEKYLEGTLLNFDLVLRSCVDCHYAFAQEKFPSLARSVTDY